MNSKSSIQNKTINLPITSKKNYDKNSHTKKTTTLFSLKPQRFSIPKDISTFSIFQKLVKEVNSNFPKLQKKIELTHILLKNRLNIIFKMRDFIIKYRLSSNCFFFAIYLMDSLIAKKIQFPIDKIGLGALVLSAKFTEIDGKVPSMIKFKDFLGNSNISLKDFIKIEIECLKKLNYVLTFPNPLNFIQLFLVNGIVFNTDIKGNNSVSSNIYSIPCQMLDYVMEENTNYFQFNPFHLACACVAQSREIYGIDRWNPILSDVFGVSFQMFEKVFYFVKE